MEEVHEFKCTLVELCGCMEGEARERAVQEMKVVGSLGCMMKERTVNMEIKKGLHDRIIVPAITYASETWVSNERQRSRIQADEMSYLISACRVRRMDGESKESLYNRFGEVVDKWLELGSGELDVPSSSPAESWPFF